MRLLRLGTCLLGLVATFMVLLNVYASMQQLPGRTFEDLRDQIIYNTQRLDTLERDMIQIRRLDSATDIRVLQNDLANHRQRMDEIERHLETAVNVGVGIIASSLGIFWFLVRRWVTAAVQTHHRKEGDDE